LKPASERTNRVRYERKAMLIMHKGGECAHCKLSYTGENGYLLDFHHLDPSKKKFTLDIAHLTKNIASLYTEANKCILLCANCHRTEHYNLHKKKVAQRDTEVTITDKLIDKE